MALPQLTPEQRAAALESARRVTRERAELKDRLKRGTVTLAGVLAEAGSDAVIGKTRVLALLRSLPGVGDTRAKQVMQRLGIAENRRAAGLGANQRAALEEEFSPVSA
jgi:hypothetical protein